MTLQLARATQGFTTYGASHLAALLVMLVGGVALVVAGRRWRASDPDDRLGKALGAAILLVTIPLQVVYFTPDHWSLQRTLPVQLCDLASVVAAYALWTHRHWATSLTYYWGLTLTPQAIITPDLSATFPHPIFLLYWGMHIGSVWAAVYLTWGRGLRPDWSGYRIAMAVTAVWAACVLVLNFAAGTNYGYLNEKPGSASALDLLGPWPWYVVAECAIIAGVWALATWPWTRSSAKGVGISTHPPG
jgi:hypothetical integral membrane protein (TIGR02206 family)